MADSRPYRADVITMINNTLTERGKDYEGQEESFQPIADVWNVIFAPKLNQPLTAADVAKAQVALKLVRDRNGDKFDNALDAAGYSVIWAALRLDDGKE